jgi:hypothetical protein
LHSSDETGDDRKGLATTSGGASADGETAKLPAHAFRERIRRASVAAAQSTMSTIPPKSSEQANHPDATSSPDGSSPALLLPEQSGVHDRKSDEPQSPQTAAEPDASESGAAAASATNASSGGSRRPTAPAWPFARDDRRSPQYHTQLGLGSQRQASAALGAAGGGEEHSDSEVSDARRRMDTRDTKRSGASRPQSSNPAPGASAATGTSPAPGTSTRPTPGKGYKITPPRPFRAHDASKWSPTSTKPQRASLLRAETHAQPSEQSEHESEASRFAKTLKEGASAHIDANIATSLSDGNSELNDDLVTLDLGAGPLDPEKYSSKPPSPDHEHDEDAARARRYTPKQRPTTQRRGRAGAKGPHEKDTLKIEREGLPNALVAHEKDTVKIEREQAVTVPDLRVPFISRPPALPLNPNVRGATRPGLPSQVVTPDTPTQPRGRPVPRLPLSGPPAVFNNQPPASTRRDAEMVREAEARHEASIVVDPALNGPFTEVQASQISEAASGSHYQPLPSDAAAFEQLMREQAAARGGRLNWKQQATLVIPRETLDAPPERRLLHPKVLFGFLAASIGGALLMLGIGHYGDPSTAIRTATPVDTSTSAAQAAAGSVTVIATEPSGAELLLDGAVIGNTPLEVVRPQRGQPELRYTVRLRGFGEQLVQLGSDSQPAIRVTLKPEP